MSEHKTIGDAARELAMPTSTLRYYERIGLVRPSARSASNYRLYSLGDLDRLRFVRAAQANGFTLEDVAALLALRASKRVLPRAVQSMLAKRISALDAKIVELHHIQGELRSLLGRCRAGEASGRCDVLITLDGLAKMKGSARVPRNPA